MLPSLRAGTSPRVAGTCSHQAPLGVRIMEQEGAAEGPSQPEPSAPPAVGTGASSHAPTAQSRAAARAAGATAEQECCREEGCHPGTASRCSQAGVSVLGTQKVREGHLQSLPYEPSEVYKPMRLTFDSSFGTSCAEWAPGDPLRTQGGSPQCSH